MLGCVFMERENTEKEHVFMITVEPRVNALWCGVDKFS